LNKADDEEGNDEEESSEESSVTSKKVKSGFCAVLSYLQRHNIDDSVFSSILNLDNANDHVSANGYTQKNNRFLKNLNKY